MGKAILMILTNTQRLAPNSPTYDDGFVDVLARDSDEDGGVFNRTGFDIKEAALAYHAFHVHYGLEFNIASPAGGECFIDPFSLKAGEHEEEVQAFLADACAMQWIKCTDRLGSFDLDRFQAVLFIGGPGAMLDFPSCKGAAHVANTIWERGGVVATIGHGSAALLSLSGEKGLGLRGKRVTGNTREEDEEMRLEKMLPFSVEKKLAEAGAKFRRGSKFSINVVEDGRLITAQNRNSTRDWIRAIERKLKK